MKSNRYFLFFLIHLKISIFCSTYANAQIVGTASNVPDSCVGLFNLLPNGDFSNGNTGFQTDYTFDDGPTDLDAQRYDIETNPNNSHAGFASFGDNTTGNGLMMVVNGGFNSNIETIAYDIDLTAGQTYTISFFGRNAVDAANAFFDVRVNNVVVASNTTRLTNFWTRRDFTWNATTSGISRVALHNNETASFGNDFALDDIFMAACTSEPVSANITKAVDSSTLSQLPATLTYTITVEHIGTSDITNPQLQDLPSQGSTSLSPTTGPVLVSGDINLDGILNQGETWTYQVTYDVTQNNFDDGENISNIATFSGDVLGTINSETIATDLVVQPNISVSKNANITNNVPVGTEVTYTYVVTNNGNQTISNIQLSDLHAGTGSPPIPENEVLSTPGGTPVSTTTTDAGVNGIWDALGPGDSVTFTGTYIVTQADIDTLQ